MAPITSSKSVFDQQRSILTLNESDEPFEVQLAHACNILGINIHDDWDIFSEARGHEALQIHTAFDPRAEWTLRWLLKEFKAAKEESASPPLHSKAWSLLRELTLRIPPSKTASLLKTHNFIAIVRNTLQWLHEIAKTRLSAPRDGGRDSLHVPDDTSGRGSDSSRDLQTSKKRKRDGADMPTSSPTPTNEHGAIDAIFMALCSAVAQIRSIIKDPDHSRAFTVEHMKSAMKSSPQDAAQILGKSWYLIHHLLRRKNKASHRDSSITSTAHNQIAINACNFHVSSAIELWNTRSPSRQDPHDIESNLAFNTYCMIPALQLLNQCREWSSLEKDVEAVTKSLEDILVKHIILPYRASKIGTETPSQASAGGNAIPLSQDLLSIFKPLSSPLLREAEFSSRSEFDLEGSIREMNAQNTIILVSLLFGVALASCTRSTPNQHRADDIWLEQLFIELTDCATMFLAGKVKKYHVTLVQGMMQKALNYKLRLSSRTLEAVLDETCYIHNEDTDLNTYWSVIGLCLQIDANVLIISERTNLGEGKPQRIPNKYLLSLLSKITDGQLQTSQDYDHVLSYIIIPLCNAFADARDLSSFIDIWTEQLTVVLRRHTVQDSLVPIASSIWEDDQLLQFVAQLVATSLTSASTERIMSKAIDGLNMVSQHVISDRAVAPAALVALDCLFTSNFHEDTLAKLTEIAGSAFHLFSVSKTKLLPQADRWRIWRIKATIADRWITLHRLPAFIRDAQTSIHAAFELVNLIPSKTSAVKIEENLSEVLHAFRFVLRFAAMEGTFGKELHSPCCSDLAAAAVRIVLDTMEPFCHRVSRDHLETIKFPDTVPQWDKSAVKVTHIEELYLGCVADILTSSDVLSYLDANIQARFVEQLYWCAVYQQKSSKPIMTGLIDYSWPWKMLHAPDVLGECASTTKHLRRFQIDQYLITSHFSEPGHWDAEKADYIVSFKSIQTIPVQALDRGHRSVIADRILRILLYAKTPSVSIVAEHLTTLAKLLAMPNNSMDILVYGVEPKMGSLEASKRAVLIRLAYGIDCTGTWSEDLVHAVSALRRLTTLVMSYLFATINQRSSMKYLNVLYDQLAGSLEATNDNKTNCSIALAAMTETSLNEYSKNNSIVGASLGILTETLKTTRLHHLESLLTTVQEMSITGASDQTYRLGIILECLVGYADLLSVHPNIEQIRARLFGADGLSGSLKQDSHSLRKENIASNRPFRDEQESEYLLARLARIEILLNARDSKFHPNIVAMSKRLNHMGFDREKRNVLESLREIMPTHSSQSTAQLWLQHIVKADACLNFTEVYLVGMAIMSLKSKEIEEVRESLSRTFTLLCKGLFQPIPFRDCMLTMQCLSLLLQKHFRLITQWHIDNLLSTINAKAASLSEKIDNQHSAMLYIGLCRLFGNILTIHRTKTGGRYHLILLALQSLLHCLFTPYDLTKPSSAFTATHAFAYARLLTTLCDPTVSSVTRSKNRSRPDLNDETKKAKSIAGQHLPYLIMEYCQCQLKGMLVPEVKAALEPGLHAVLSVMTLDAMRTMNAALDESGRAVWKAFYEDWRRLGGGLPNQQK